MLSYLLGDVMRIFAGDFTPGKIEGKKLTQKMLFGMGIFMLIPIVMLILSLTLQNPLNRWVNIIVAIGLFGFNLAGLRGYSSFDKFLQIVGFAFNGLTIWYAWNWI